MLELHRSRFVEWQPAAVVALAVAPGGLTVALARETGDLEIYDTTDWRCTARVPGHDGAAVSSLTWCAPYQLDGVDPSSTGNGAGGGGGGAVSCRLLSAGLDGQITEWDLSTLRPRGATDSHGGAVWSMAAEPAPRRGTPQRVAIACDDGCVRLLTLMDGDGVGRGLHHRRSFNRVQGRLLSLAWGHGGSAIAAGSSCGTIHVFDVESLIEITRITVGGGDRPKEGEERCVWALQYLPDGTIVSGSSDGDVTFWDGQHGTQLSSFRQHRADVLALAVSPDGSAVFASGVDSQIAVFEKLDTALGGEGDNRWAFTGTKRPHTHDVRALAIAAAAPSGGGGGGGGIASGDADKYQETQVLYYCHSVFAKHLGALNEDQVMGYVRDEGVFARLAAVLDKHGAALVPEALDHGLLALSGMCGTEFFSIHGAKEMVLADDKYSTHASLKSIKDNHLGRYLAMDPAERKGVQALLDTIAQLERVAARPARPARPQSGRLLADRIRMLSGG
mmetsp:Transcript_21460/g.53252  ORF Transcript_21460/g.53252 Transcript_21460/m.53252 type:complete len:504 (-) Transcript_21460:511-2022(-)